MTLRTPRGVLLLVFAIAVAACDGPPSPSGPTPLSPGEFRVTRVTGISPSTGSTARATPVMISGTGFFSGARVTVGVVAGSVSVVSSTTITALIPARAAGTADVVVTNQDGSGDTLTAAFTYSVHEPFSLTASADAVDAGSPISVSWTAPGGRASDWIAVCPVGEHYADDWYVLTKGATSGMQTVLAPMHTGQYEFRYLLDDGFFVVARSSPFTVR
jgi:hypothetical protein